MILKGDWKAILDILTLTTSTAYTLYDFYDFSYFFVDYLVVLVYLILYYLVRNLFIIESITLNINHNNLLNIWIIFVLSIHNLDLI